MGHSTTGTFMIVSSGKTKISRQSNALIRPRISCIGWELVYIEKTKQNKRTGMLMKLQWPWSIIARCILKLSTLRQLCKGVFFRQQWSLYSGSDSTQIPMNNHNKIWYVYPSLQFMSQQHQVYFMITVLGDLTFWFILVKGLPDLTRSTNMSVS